MTLLLVYLALALGVSFLCSILEAVLLSVGPTFINLKKQEGKDYARLLEKLKNDVDKPLIAILSLNTIAHTVGAILVGAEAKAVYAAKYGNETRELLGMPFTEDLMVGVVSGIMTLLILVASEIIPKTIGAVNWKRLARFTAICSQGLVVFFTYFFGLLPILQLFTRLVGKTLA